jgi:hypothetical protein
METMILSQINCSKYEMNCGAGFEDAGCSKAMEPKSRLRSDIDGTTEDEKGIGAYDG